LLSTSLLTEVILGWPGLGPLVLESLLARDTYVVMAVVMLSSVFLVFGNLVADLLLYSSDPRIRAV
jgi:peptide/nickel transport system permease protein